MSSLDRVDHVPAAGAVEAQDQLAVVALAERVLELVAVAPLLDRRHDRLAPPAARSHRGARAPRRTCCCFWPAGARRAAPATARRGAAARGSMRSGLGVEQLGHARLGERALGLLDLGARGRRARRRARTPRSRLGAAHAGAAVRERVDRDLDLLALAGTDTGGRGGLGHGPHAGRVGVGWRLVEPAGDVVQDRLAVGVAALVVAHLAQLGRAQVAQAGLHLGHGQVVVAGDGKLGPSPAARRALSACASTGSACLTASRRALTVASSTCLRGPADGAGAALAGTLVAVLDLVLPRPAAARDRPSRRWSACGRARPAR